MMWPFKKKDTSDGMSAASWQSKYEKLYKYTLGIQAEVISKLDPAVFDEIRHEKANLTNTYQHLDYVVDKQIANKNSDEAKIKQWVAVCDVLADDVKKFREENEKLTEKIRRLE